MSRTPYDRKMPSQPVSKVVRRKVKLRNTLGLHARPSTQIAALASRFESEIFLIKEEPNGQAIKANAKSVFGIMMLTAPMGTELVIEATGPDAEEAVEALVHLIEVEKFNED